MLKTTILKASFSAIHHSGLAKRLHASWGGAGVIFCLHHVCPGGGRQLGFAPNNNLEITPEFLGDIIKLIQAKGYDLVSIGEAAERIKSGSADQKRFAVFTLDDGYRDNLQYAMPVFNALNCPFTVYVAPRIADGTCELWWRLLEAAIAKVNQLDVVIEKKTFRLPTTNENQKVVAWQTLAPVVQRMDEFKQRQWIRSLCERLDINWHLICREAAMTWDEIRLMAKNPLATIGAHTLNHYNLSKLSVADARREIIESGLRVSTELDTPVRHFAYPYGNVDAAGKREFELCKSAGYETSVVTRLGAVWPEHRNHLQALPRIMVSGRYQDLAYIDALVSGVPAMLSNKFRRMNVS